MMSRRKIGPYTLIERLGQGGMGEVWLAEDVTGAAGGAPRRVALKLLDPAQADDPVARARFAREVQAARRVVGPTVAALLDANVDDSQPWLASVYVAGPTLSDHITAHGALSGAALRSLGRALAEALASIHVAGVVHRDLTPRNVVLGPDGPRVVDFGIAWYEGAAQVTKTGERVGTPQYVAPERLTGDEVTPAGDVWSWGAVMTYAASGRPPVGGGSSEAVADRIARGDLDLDGVPTWLAPWVSASLAVHPAARPDVGRLVAAMAGDDVTTPAVPTPRDVTTEAEVPPTRRYPPHPGTTRRYPDGPADGGRVAARGNEPDGGAVPGARRGVYWISTLVVLGTAAVVGRLVPIALVATITALTLVAAVGLRAVRERRSVDVRPVPPTWAAALAAPVMLGVGLTQVVGVVLALAIMAALVVVLLVLGGDIGV